jgi:hypothetical protein
LEFLKALVDEVTFAFLVPDIPDLSYYIEYFDADHESGVNFIETNKTALRIRQLEPNTRYKVGQKIRRTPFKKFPLSPKENFMRKIDQIL